MIDFHTHTLPYADHGCDGEETSRLQMAAALEAGVETLCVTPHFYPHRHTLDVFREKRRVGLAALENIEEKPRLIHGAEVLLCEEMHRMEGLRELCLEGTDVMLLEMPNRPFSRELADTVRGIERLGITPVLAHIERYLRLQSPAVWDRLRESGILMQVNADFFGDFRTRRKAIRMLANQDLQLIGSDCHNLTDRAPQIDKAYDLIQKKLGEGFVDQMNDFASSLLA